ncbi:hypothetical protein N9Q54_00795 [Octadecabacter sp.]|nr:hypothetical protein [Octadecabacter sp.]
MDRASGRDPNAVKMGIAIIGRPKPSAPFATPPTKNVAAAIGKIRTSKSKAVSHDWGFFHVKRGERLHREFQNLNGFSSPSAGKSIKTCCLS